jgi:hypothetical protein
VGSIYGGVSVLNGAALIVFGVAAIQARRWTGWRRLLLLVLGIYVIVPLTPAIFGPLVLARLTIGLWGAPVRRPSAGRCCGRRRRPRDRAR